ncbi:App1 family protein [Fibrella aquatica]|uniref:App1 family protein n=1 Tax=Fibrella aquatica TaxID=3242487 RepID=UPI00351FDCF5
MKPYQIIYFRGFGSPHAIWLTGRVLRQNELASPADRAPFWENLSATVSRFLTTEVGGITVRIETFGQVFRTVTDKDGYFNTTIDPNIELPAGRAWFPVRYVLEGVEQPEGYEGPSGSGTREVIKDGQLMIAPAYSQFGIISDIDDTVLVTGATNIWQTLKLTFLENAFSRMPFAGVSAFYRALQSGATTTLFNPIYFVSSSPWNIYDLLIDFFRIQGIPKGPLLLRNIELNADFISSKGHHTHKRDMIDKILAVNPDLPFVLLGDSGQQDPEIYADVIEANPGRIKAVYIRDVTIEDRRDEDVRKLIQAAANFNVPMMLVTDTVAAAEHAASLGLIDPDTLPEIRADRQADEEK